MRQAWRLPLVALCAWVVACAWWMSPAVGITAPRAMEPLDPATLVVAALQAQVAAGTFRVEQNFEGTERTVWNGMEVIVPDRRRTWSSDGLETVEVEGGFYWRRDEGDWQGPSPIGTGYGGQLPLLTDPARIAAFGAAAHEFEPLRVEEANGTLVWRTSFLYETGSPSGLVEHVTLWVNPADGRPQHAQLDGWHPEGEAARYRVELTYWDYGAPLSIEPPISADEMEPPI
jgi:hypothetical protein